MLMTNYASIRSYKANLRLVVWEIIHYKNKTLTMNVAK